MHLNIEQLKELSNIAIEAAQKAGQLVTERSKEKLTVNTKVGGDCLASQVFTEVDLACEKLILDALHPTLEKFDLAMLTEESADDGSRFQKDYFWCIDPLDGTLPFLDQTDGYSVSIGLVDKTGVPHIGVIYNPVDATLYHAIKGVGAYKNQQKWQLNTPAPTLTLVCDRSFLDHPRYDEVEAKLNTLSAVQLKKICHGGAAMNAMWVLENHPATYFKFPKKEDGAGSLWDYAASACIFNEIGAYASAFNGDQLDLNRPDSTFLNHQGISYASDAGTHIKVRELLG
ncbi:MAG: hypothetical protein N4A71_28195 [Carboxylicivirga sp.]|jgi:fructose-1,6-bisphosphatase/inositol monophosphatase family enzyme|nr:hypothetical protein [Carboxylicivirga sp.]